MTVYAYSGADGWALSTRPNGQGRPVWPGYAYQNRADLLAHCRRHGLTLATDD